MAVCHAAPEGKGSLCCGYSEDRCRRKWHTTSMRVQAARLRLGSRDCVAVKLLSTQIVRNRRKQFSSSTTRHVACNVVVNAFQQYEGLVNLATAKVERRRLIFALAHPPLRGNGANSLEIHDGRLLKSGASRQEKPSACNMNCAATNEHFCHDVVFDGRADMNAAGTVHLNSLLDDDRLTASRCSMTHKVGDAAAGSRTGSRIFASVKLHAGVPVCS